MNSFLYIVWAIQLFVITFANPNRPGETFLIFGVAIFSSIVTVFNAGWMWLPVPLIGIMILGFFLKGFLKQG